MLPEHLRTKLRRDPDLRVAAWGATRKFAKGQFRFGGLTEDWTGTISSSSDAFVIQGMNEGELVFGGTLLQLSRPATGLILDLRRIPGFRGRVLWRDTGKAVRGARVLFKLARKTGRQWSAMTDAASDGKFTMTLDEGVILDEARYRLYVEGSVDRGTIALDSEQLQTWNLGDLYVDRAPVTHYLVVDSEGQAIQGAFVEFCSNRVTDASGRGWIAAGKRKSVYVAAVGYRIQRFELTEPGTMEEPFVFRLAVGNSLTVRFMDGRGDEMPYASLMLRSTKNPFMGMTRGINRPFGLHEKIGNSTVISSRSQQDGKWYALLSRGSKAGSGFHLVSMRPGVEVTLQVLDSVGAVITESTVRTPDYGDFEEELWIKTDLAPRTVTLNFVDLSGQPIPTPLVVTLGVAGLERNWIADADGRLEVAGVFSDTTLARFKRDGFVQQIHAEFSLAKSTPTVTLLPGRRMDISVVDADGTPIEVDWLRADLSSPKYVLHSTRLSLGKYRLVDLPSGPIKIVLRRGKQRYEFRRDSSQAEIVLPVR